MNKTCSLLANVTDAARNFPNPPEDLPLAEGKAEVVLSGGCFWCTEAVYRQLEGVTSVTSVYAGDTEETANYTAVSTGATNHAEAVRIEYDPSRITLGAILKVFFSVAHNPTHLDRQADDVGRHYRSAIFYADEDQRRVAQSYVRALDAARAFDAPIVTTLEPFSGFFLAEADFQNYAARNPADPYVVAKSLPKVKKAREWFADNLKREG